MRLCQLCLRLATRSQPRITPASGRFFRLAPVQRSLVCAAVSNRQPSFRNGLNPNLIVQQRACLSTEATAEKTDHTAASGGGEVHEFQAETRQLLDIVARSLYSEKEVFIRELISNASDALEKLRYLQLAQAGTEPDSQAAILEIDITTDVAKRQFVIQDNGIGMTKAELVDNLGTIARSGSKAFLNELETSKGADGAPSMDSIIGQFGVGFYSAFMVADKVEVVTRSAKENADVGYLWHSDGSGFYEIQELTGDNLPPLGTKVTVALKAGDPAEYADAEVIKNVIRKYSNFVSAPIMVNGEQVNTVEALWCAADPKAVTTEQHEQFYKFISHRQHDRPRYTIQYKTDAPINIRALLYVPSEQPNPFMIRNDALEAGIALYSRRVLIQARTDKILPRWLRFMRGVVDSEDIPLNLSRELLQQGLLISKLRQTISSRVIRHFQSEMKKDAEKYAEFFKDYNVYFKEAIAFSEDQSEKEDIAKLLLFESSNMREGSATSLSEYVSRMQDDQKEIYYLCAPNRHLAETSPYFEQMRSKSREILFAYEPADEIVLMQLRQFDAKNLVSVEKWLKLHEDAADGNNKIIDDLSSSDRKDFLKWMQLTLGSRRCENVLAMTKDSSYPCIITVEDMGAARHFLRSEFDSKLSAQARLSMLKPTLEVNSAHPIMRKLNLMRKSDAQLAELLAEQVYDNALVTAGLMSDSRPMIGRLNKLLSELLQRNDASTGQILTP